MVKICSIKSERRFRRSVVTIAWLVANGQIEKGGVNLVKVYKHKNPLWILNAP